MATQQHPLWASRIVTEGALEDQQIQELAQQTRADEHE
ncbi:MAG: hypothetical protein ACI9EF_001747 [Pseudohongiellaceae bacterium]|jgi:hypothetical protein